MAAHALARKNGGKTPAFRDSMRRRHLEETRTMIVVMKADASMSDISGVVKALESMGYKPHPTRGAERTIIGVVDARQGADFSQIEGAAGVDQVIPITKAYKMVSREFRPQNTIVNVNG